MFMISCDFLIIFSGIFWYDVLTGLIFIIFIFLTIIELDEGGGC